MSEAIDIGGRMYLELQDIVNDAVADSGDVGALPRIQLLLREWDHLVTVKGATSPGILAGLPGTRLTST